MNQDFRERKSSIAKQIEGWRTRCSAASSSRQDAPVLDVEETCRALSFDSQWKSTSRPNVPLSGIFVASTLVLVLFQLGCGSTVDRRTEIESDYGQQRSARSRRSVNGTTVLAKMYRARGHDVDAWSRMSPKMDDYETVLWFPDSYGIPDERVQEKIGEWVSFWPNRTFVYVEREFDAEELYWEMVLADARRSNEAVERIDEIRRRLAYVKSRNDRRRRIEDPSFATESRSAGSSGGATRVNEVDPSRITGAWTGEFDSAASNLVVTPEGAKGPPFKSMGDWRREPLLVVDGEPVIVRYRPPAYRGNGSQFIYVQNGSFLLNFPLVNHENRELATAIMDESGAADRVLFLESGPGGIEVIDHIDQSRQPTPWDWVSVWPMSFIVPHLFVLAIVFCVAYYPIFGRAKTGEGDEHRSDFGKHLRALGGLFAKTGQNQYMLDKIRLYEEQVRRDSGSSHLK